jgi:hypothetical protein
MPLRVFGHVPGDRQQDDPHRDEDKEQNLGDPPRGAGDRRETENARNNGQQEKKESGSQHRKLTSRGNSDPSKRKSRLSGNEADRSNAASQGRFRGRSGRVRSLERPAACAAERGKVTDAPEA